MTKKDYVAVAARLADLRKTNGVYDREGYCTAQLIQVEEMLADIFQSDNARFDRTRFLQMANGGARA